jgi:F0F1-type ATP synthase epsilon subunit
VKSFKVRILTPDTPPIEVADAASVVVPSVPGSFGVLADHAPTVAAVGAGVMRYSDQSGQWRYVVLGDGTADVSRDEMVLLVAFARTAGDENQAEELLDRMTRTV